MNHLFGQNLRVIRLRKKLSQDELGKQLNKGQKTIGNWETGYSEPCMEDLIRISSLFDITIDCLLKEQIKEDNPKAKADRNRYKEKELQAENFPHSIPTQKLALHETTNNGNETGNNETKWRDKYIIILEKRLSETLNYYASEETIQNLILKIIALQKTIAKLNGTSSGDTDNSSITT